MITWGISAASHNAAVAVFDDDRLIFASDSERFSKIKNDPDLCHELISHARKFGDPELVCWYEKPWLKTLRQLTS
jgi:carbamoyltransferase